MRQRNGRSLVPINFRVCKIKITLKYVYIKTTLPIYSLFPLIAKANSQYLKALAASLPVRFCLRPVSTQENKHRIGLDFFPSCIIRTAGPKKVESTSTLYHPGCGSQVQAGTEYSHRKPMHARVQFCPDPVRSHAYFSEWKSALIRGLGFCPMSKFCQPVLRLLLRDLSLFFYSSQKPIHSECFQIL